MKTKLLKQLRREAENEYPSWMVSGPRAALASLIDKFSGKGTWNRNPWVWIYEFELVK